jgi:hypothetical protein
VSEAEAIAPDGAVRRFKPYSSYKDSGIGWLGKIPTDSDRAAEALAFIEALRAVLVINRATLM